MIKQMSAGKEIPALCQELDSTLAREKIRLEDVNARSALLQPLEKAVADMPSEPDVPDTAAGKIAAALWFKSHSQQADLEKLILLINDESPLVRLSAVDAVIATLRSSNRLWREPHFFFLARQVILHSRELETSPVIAYQMSRVTEQISKLSLAQKSKRPKVVLNPYVAGMPVQGRESFFGREDILRRIKNYLSRTEGSKSVVLYGARRTGKTSVLFQIRDGALGDSFVPVYLDMQRLAGTDVKTLLGALVANTQAAVREHLGVPQEFLPPIDPHKLTFTALRDFLKGIQALLGDRSLLLMIDEYEVLQSLLADKGVTQQMQSIVEQEDMIYVIFAGSQKLESLSQKKLLVLFDNAHYIKISFLKREEAERLITEPSQGMLEFSPGVTDLIVEYTAGHPFYTQLLCQAIFDSVKVGGKVETKHVEDAVREFLLNPSPHLILTWNSMEPIQKVVGSTLAALQCDREAYQTPQAINERLRLEGYPVKFIPGEIQQGLRALSYIDWVEQQPGESAYRFTMELVRRWVAESRSIIELAEEQRTQMLSKVAGFWPQLFAAVTDWAIFAVIFLGIANVFKHSSVETSAYPVAALSEGLAAILYFVIPIAAARATLGSRFFNLRAVGISILPLKAGRAILYGALLIARFSVGLLLVKSLWRLLDPSTAFSPTALAVIFITALMIALDIFMTLYGQKHQGLYERLARTLLVPASAIRY